MNLDELQSVRSRERQADSPQKLRATFYQDAAEFIEELRGERDRAAERADDPFASQEVRRLTDDIQTARSTVEAIYERRVGKVVKRASIAAAGMPTERDGLTEEEQELFDALVDRIEASRNHVLDEVLEGRGSDVSFSREEGGSDTADSSEPEAESGSGSTPDDTAASGAVDAADLMGSGPQDAGAEASSGSEAGETGASGAPESAPGQRADSPPEPPTADLDPVEEPPPDPTDAGSAGETDNDSRPADRSSEDDGTAGSGETLPGMPRTTVRITDEVGEVVGADDRDYDLGAEDVVTLPESNADVLVDKDAAERL